MRPDDSVEGRLVRVVEKQLPGTLAEPLNSLTENNMRRAQFRPCSCHALPVQLHRIGPL